MKGSGGKEESMHPDHKRLHFSIDQAETLLNISSMLKEVMENIDFQ